MLTLAQRNVLLQPAWLSPNFPRSLPGLAAWYDQADRNSMVLDGSNRCSLLSDKSGNSPFNCLVNSGGAGGGAYLTTGVSVGAGDFSVMGWIRIPLVAPAADTTIGGCSSNNTTFAGGSNRMEVQLRSDGTLGMLVADGSAQTVLYVTANLISLYAGQWVHLAAIRSGSSFIAYINGALITLTYATGSAAVNASVDSTYFLIGYRTATSSYNGNIRSIRLYLSALTAQNVLDDYNGAKMAGSAVDVDFTLAAKMAATFTCLTGQTVTIATIGDYGARISGERDRYNGTVSKQPLYLPPIGESTVYTSDFSVNADGWAQNIGDVNLTATGNVDGIAGVNDVLQFLASGANKTFQIVRSSGGPAVGRRFRITFDYYAEVGAFSGGAYWGIGYTNSRQDVGGVQIVEGAWQSGVTLVGIENQVGPRFSVFTTLTGGAVAPLQSGKKIYLKNVVFTQLAQEKPRLFHDSNDDCLKSAPFYLPQPSTTCMFGSLYVLNNNRTIIGGFNGASGQVYRVGTATPDLRMWSGSGDVGPLTSWAIQERALISAVLNGASSLLRKNRETPASGNPGTNAMNGIGVASDGGGSGYCSVLEEETAVCSTPLDLATLDLFAAYISNKWGVKL
jgi:hypothetical protein